MKFGGCLALNIDFEVTNFQLLEKTHRKTSIFELQLVKIEGSLGSLAQNACFEAPTCLVWSLWLRRVSGGSCKPFVFRCVKVSNLEEALHTPHFAVHILHSTLYTVHSTLDTAHCTFHTSHYSTRFALYISHFLFTL